jgi:hypothetical protein
MRTGLEVVDEHRVGVVAVDPHSHGVRLVRLRLRLAGDREVARALDELLRVGRVGDIDEGHAADALGFARADLVLVCEHLAFEELGLEVDDL